MSNALNVVRIVKALILRESRTRFGRSRIGFAWAILEPLAHVAIIGTIFTLVGRTAPNGIDVFMFIITGVVPFHLFSKTATRLMGAVDGNRALLNYPVIQPIDTLLARYVLELGVYIVVFVIMASAGLMLGMEGDFHDPLTIICAFAAVSLVGAGFGFALCAAKSLFPVTERIVPLVNRLLFFTSGLFYALSEIPVPVADVLQWNPIIQANEIIRTGVFKSFRSDYADPAYLFMATVIVLSAGLSIYRITENNPRSSIRGGTA